MKRVICFLIGGAAMFMSWLCLLFCLLGVIITDCTCFAVDSDNNLYLGIRNTVYVYDGELLIREMPMLGRACVFTILEDDTMLWSTSTYAYITDLEQNTLKKWEDKGSDVFYQLKGNVGGNKVYIASDGTRYEKHDQFGGFQIYRESELIYESPIAGRIFAVLIIVFAVIGVSCLVLYKRGNLDE